MIVAVPLAACTATGHEAGQEQQTPVGGPVGTPTETTTETPLTGTPPTATDHPPPEEPVDGVPDAAWAYLEAMASADPSHREAGLALAAPDSAAAAYARFQLAQAEALHGQEVPVVDATVQPAGDALRVCHDADCVTFADFQVASSELSAFTIDGRDVGSRVVAGGAAAELGPATVEVDSALLASTENSLSVALRLQGGAEAVDLNIYVSRYLQHDGSEFTAGDATGPVELAPGETAVALLVFYEADLGGTVTVEASSIDGSQAYTAQLDVPAA